MKLLILMLLSSTLFSANYDPTDEENKILKRFDLDGSISRFNEYEEPDDPLELKGFKRLLPVFDPEDDDLPYDADNSLAMEASIQKEIGDELQAYISESIHKEKLLKIKSDFINAKFNKGEEALDSDLAFLIAAWPLTRRGRRWAGLAT